MLNYVVPVACVGVVGYGYMWWKVSQPIERGQVAQGGGRRMGMVRGFWNPDWNPD